MYPLIQPTVSVSPAVAGAGGCVCLQNATTSGNYESVNWRYEYQNYKYTAIPANGWRFARLHVTTTYANIGTAYDGTYTEQYIITDESETTIYSDGSTYTTYNRKANYDAAVGGYVFSTTFPATFHMDGIAYSSETTTPPTAYSYMNSCTVVAEFERILTHLLVNSSTAENPAKLVYDPTTNLLVADY